MQSFWIALACALYLAPLVALALVARRPQGDALDLACTIATVFAGDFLGTFLLCYLVRVDQAAFLRTGIVAAVALAWALVKRRRQTPLTLTTGGLAAPDLTALALGAVFAFGLSHVISSEFWIWDREWHDPFSASLRGQRMPFRNVFDPNSPIRYHLSGDLFSALVQSLSFVTLHATRAVALAHDLLAAIMVGMTALLLRSSNRWPPATCAVAAMMPALGGPIALRSPNQATFGAYEGYSDFNNFTLSFRPHTIMALTLLTALLCHVVRRSRNEKARPGQAWSDLIGWFPVFAILAISDEISTALAGVSLALLWLWRPRFLAGHRWQGALVLGGLALTALLANLVLAGTIAPGGVVEKTRWVAPRLPHFLAAPLPITFNSEPWKQLFIDTGSLVLPAAVMIWYVARQRRAGPLPYIDRVITAPAVLALGVLAGGLLLFLCFEVNERTLEGHRFLTGARILVPAVSLLFLPRLAATSLAAIVLLAPIAAGNFATLGQAFYRLPQNREARSASEHFQIDCRSDFEARIGEVATPIYVEPPIWYLYSGCHPIFAAGHDGPSGVVLAGRPRLGPEGFAKMDRTEFPPGQPVLVGCTTNAAENTPVCKKAAAVGSCRPAGKRASLCTVPAQARAALGKP